MVPGPATLSPGSETEESPEDRMIVCPAGGYNVCPGGESPEAPNPEDVTENPLGTCRCNGEVWVSEGCTHAFYCDDTLDIGGQYFSCPGVS